MTRSDRYKRWTTITNGPLRGGCESIVTEQSQRISDHEQRRPGVGEDCQPEARKSKEGSNRQER